MSYRVDIPTLSANEVYTLTFEYEGTETIQLIVGDLTLETTDRRVVFTTTSPVNYIESNMNLTNLNIYEGYYESDDFGGEYTQESYIEGKSLINLFPPSSPKTLTQGHSLDFDETTGLITITFTDNTNDFNCTARAYGLMKYLKPSTDYTFVIDILENSLVDANGNASTKPLYFFNTSAYASPNTQQPFIGGSSKGDVVKNGTPTIEGSVGRYLCGIRTVDTFLDTMSADMALYTVAHNGTLKAKIMVLEGDYTESGIETNWFPQGIGCVKSPTIISHEDSNNLFYIKDYTCTVNGGTVYSRNGKISFSGYFRTYTNIDIIKGGVWDSKPNCYYEPGTYYLKAHYKTIKPKPDNNTHTANFVFVCADGTTKELIGMPGVHMGGTFNTVQQDTLTVTSPIVKICYKVWYGGTRDWVTIENVSISKVNREYTQGEEDNAILETSVVSTPDDLELYGGYDSGGNWYGDKLDLTTGTFYQYYDMWDLATLLSQTEPQGAFYYNANTSIVSVQWNLKNTHPSGTVWNGVVGYSSALIGNYFEYGYEHTEAKTSPYIGFTNQYLYIKGMSYDKIFNGVTIVNDSTLKSSEAKNALIQFARDNNLKIGLPLNTPTTKQININLLKSYRNGSIQTSSQQLAPTLKTTLPISNKFTTTNLTSGSTYNIYFDGTATKLDAGGTIITDPVSPCEVECGGTTLTIEGTDIQNVRVIETSVKNEVGNNSTSDVELAKIVAYEHNNIASNVRYSKNSYTYQCSVKLDNTNHSFNISGAHISSHGSVNTGINYPSGISLVHIACDITMPSENLMANIHFGNGVWNSYQNFQNVTLNNDTATIKQTTQDFSINNSYKNFFSTVVTGGHYSNLMYVVSKNNVQADESFIITVFTMAGQTLEGYTGVGRNGVTISNLRVKVLENYPNITTLDNVTSVLRENDGSTIIWEDMDLTFIQNISDLEQPIKLRSLGTTYDSYNPVTGELTKRIGVSETDGSYSVLSSPIVSKVMKVETITNVFPYLTNVVGDTTKIVLNSATYDEDNWVYFHNKKGSHQAINYLDMSNFKPNTDYTWFVEVKNNTLDGVLDLSMESSTSVFDNVRIPIGFNGLFVFKQTTKSDFTKLKRSFMIQKWYTTGGTIDFRITIVEGDYTRTTVPHFISTQNVVFPINQPETPHLYTNGQVKVYSDSEVYPTTILNGQSTNNYEVNELNKSNNYTIRYEGECESVILNGKSNEQGTNRIVKTSTNGSGNLTFVNNSEDIDNVLLVQNDVREQEINHFNGLQTVEISKMLIQNQRNMFCYKDISVPDGGYIMSVTPIPVQPGETLYCVVYNSVRHSSLIEYDSDMKQLRNTEINYGYGDNGNAVKLTENTYYVKVVTGAGFENRVMISREGFLPLELCENIYQGAYIDLPQPVQLNSLPDGTCDTYNPITGEYMQRVNGKPYSGDEKWNRGYTDLNCISYFLSLDRNRPDFDTSSYCTDLKVLKNSRVDEEGYFIAMGANYEPVLTIRLKPETLSGISFKNWLQQSGLVIFHEIKPITTQLTPINIPTFEGVILQLITTDGKVFPMVEYSMPTNNRYDTSSWETGKVYTQRNMTEAYFNESTTPMTPTETMTLTTDHISSGSIILNDNGNGLIVLKGNYTGRDIPYFTGMRSVEAIEVETAPSPDQPLFGKGGRK